MAELFGIVAAASGLAEVGARLALSISWLCTSLASAPEQITRLSNSINLLIKLGKAIEIHQDVLLIGGATERLSSLQLLLDDCVDQAGALATMLNELTVTVDAGKLQRRWKSILAVIKQKGILRKCEELEKAKELLVLWFSTFNAFQSSVDHETMQELRRSIGSLLLSAAASVEKLDMLPVLDMKMDQLNSTLKDIDSRTNTIKAKNTLSEATLDTQQARTSEIQISINQSSAEGLNTSANLFRKIDAIGPSVDALVAVRLQATDALIQEKLERMERKHTITHQTMVKAIHEFGAPIADSFKFVRKLTETPENFRRMLDSQTRSTEEYEMSVKNDMSSYERRMCYCSPKKSRSRKWPVSFISITTDSIHHKISCPARRLGACNIRRRIDVNFASRLLGRALVIFYESKLGAGGNSILSLSHTLKRIVPLDSSPLRGWSLLCTEYFYSAVGLIEFEKEAEQRFCILLDELRDGLAQRKFTVFDVDETGNTLLQASVREALFFAAYVPKPYLGTFCYRLINFLMQWGPKTDSINVLNELWTLTQIMVNFPHMFEEWNCGAVTCAIIQKDLQQLTTLLENGSSVSEKNTYGQTPLHMSSDWSPGLRKLLSYGADREAMDLSGSIPLYYTLKLENQEAFELLLNTAVILDQDGSLKDPYCEVLLAIWKSPVDFQKKFYRQAAEIYEQFCSQSALESQNSLLGKLSDQTRITNLSSKLELRRGAKKFHEISSACRLPPPLVSAYHRPLDHSKSISLELANFLYNMGFHDLDIHDYSGLTPLLQRCYHKDLEMISWLLQRGVLPSYDPFGHGPLHMLVFDSDLSFYINDSGPSYILPKSQRYLSLRWIMIELLTAGYDLDQRDCCNCPCSPDGCSPSSILFRNADIFHGPDKSRLQFLISVIREQKSKSSDKRREMKSVCTAWARNALFNDRRMKHTCCREIYPEGRLAIGMRDPDEAAQIDAERLACLDDLDDSVEKYEEELMVSEVLMASSSTILDFHLQWWARECHNLHA